MYILIIIIIIISCNKQTECNSLATDTALSQPDHHTTTITNTPTTTITKTKTNNNNKNKITKNHQSNPTGNKDNSAKDTVNKYSDNITTTIIKDPTNMYTYYITIENVSHPIKQKHINIESQSYTVIKNTSYFQEIDG